MAEIINPNNPVYFTYARNSDAKAEWRHIADVVPDLLEAFRSEGVKYSVDAEDIKNGEKISSYEKEIGKANYVIVVLSDRYFYRYHCMFELSNVLKRRRGKTIKYIKAGNFNLNSIEYQKKIKKHWSDQKFEIEYKIKHNNKISELEQVAIKNNYYDDFIDKLSDLFRSVNYTNAESLRKKLLGQNSDQVKFVTEIKKDFGWKPASPTPPKPIFNENFILYSLIAVLFFWVLLLSNRELPDRGTGSRTDTITKTTDTIPLTGDKTETHPSKRDTTVTLPPKDNKTEIPSPKGDTTATLPPKDNYVPSAIELGLSVLWADRNIGADSPTDYGDYFAWGEIKPKDTYSWDNYKHCQDGDVHKLTKYCTDGYYGEVDNKIILVPDDDAATQNLGNDWWIPTGEEYEELFANCNWKWTKKDGVNGCEFTSKKNGNKIFFPAAGEMWPTLSCTGILCSYWSSSLGPDLPSGAQYLRFLYGDTVSVDWSYRYRGFPVRAVRRKD